MSYRPCVGIIVINRKSKIFAGRSVGKFNYNWQMPQGGIEQGEEPIEAAYRELYEETGIKNVELLGEMPEWLKYDLPKKVAPGFWKGKYIGQRQKWFLMRFMGKDQEIDLTVHKPEYSEWKWETADFLLEKAPPFKLDIYKRLFEELLP